MILITEKMPNKADSGDGFQTPPESETFSPTIILATDEVTGGFKSMSKGRDWTTSWRQDRTWENKRNNSERASSLPDTQRQAEQAAKEMLRNQGVGELTSHAPKSSALHD